VSHGYDDPEVKFIISRKTEPFVVQGSQKVRLPSNSIGHTVVVVLGSIVPILNEMVLLCNHKRTSPMLLLDHKHRVPAYDDHVDFPSPTIGVRNPDRFVNFPTVPSPSSPREFC
jgi:hypothetical protein